MLSVSVQLFMVSNFDFRQSLDSHDHSFSLVIKAPHFHFFFIPSFVHTRRQDGQDGFQIATNSTRQTRRLLESTIGL